MLEKLEQNHVCLCSVMKPPGRAGSSLRSWPTFKESWVRNLFYHSLLFFPHFISYLNRISLLHCFFPYLIKLGCKFFFISCFFSIIEVVFFAVVCPPYVILICSFLLIWCSLYKSYMGFPVTHVNSGISQFLTDLWSDPWPQPWGAPTGGMPHHLLRNNDQCFCVQFKSCHTAHTQTHVHTPALIFYICNGSHVLAPPPYPITASGLPHDCTYTLRAVIFGLTQILSSGCWEINTDLTCQFGFIKLCFEHPEDYSEVAF